MSTCHSMFQKTKAVVLTKHDQLQKQMNLLLENLEFRFFIEVQGFHKKFQHFLMAPNLGTRSPMSISKEATHPTWEVDQVDIHRSVERTWNFGPATGNPKSSMYPTSEHFVADTLPETNSSPLKIGLPNRKVVFQPSIFRGYVSFREGIWPRYTNVGDVNPFEKYARPIGSCPQVRVKIKNIWSHHLVYQCMYPSLRIQTSADRRLG